MLNHKTASNTCCSYLLKIIAFEDHTVSFFAHSNLRPNGEERLWPRSSTDKSNLFTSNKEPTYFMEMKNRLIKLK